MGGRAPVPTAGAPMPVITLQVEPRLAEGAPVRFRVDVHNAGAEPVTLELLMRDYVVHLEHHLGSLSF